MYTTCSSANLSTIMLRVISLYYISFQNKNYHIAQVDFVPTIALLLGLPIPFSNLGTVVPELFNHCPWWEKNGTKIQQIYHSIEALRLNAHQIRTYIKVGCGV